MNERKKNERVENTHDKETNAPVPLVGKQPCMKIHETRGKERMNDEKMQKKKSSQRRDDGVQ